MDDMPDFGNCCWCNGTDKVRNIVTFEYETPNGGPGWACVQCGLPARGATAVACDACADGERIKEEPQWLAGLPITERLPVPSVADRVPFHHDARRHPELARLN